MEIEEDGDDYIMITPTGDEIVVREKRGLGIHVRLTRTTSASCRLIQQNWLRESMTST